MPGNVMQEKVKTGDDRTMSVALAGNPNSGKTCIFNSLTGARQHVGNWPGVTVEKKEGRLVSGGRQIGVVDLPGIYSLGAYSEDEVVARDYMLLERPDVVVNVVDATNLERNLYLTLQLLEMGANVVIALNMFDELKGKSMKVDAGKLSHALGVPVVPTVAIRNEGIPEMIRRIVGYGAPGARDPLRVDYGKELESEIGEIERHFKSNEALTAKYPSRWLAVKLLEGDEGVKRIIGEGPALEAALARRNEAVKRLEPLAGEDIGSLIADRRYAFISGIARVAVTRSAPADAGLSVSDRIDRVVTNRFLGLPIFLAAMWVVFHLTFTWGAPLADWLDYNGPRNLDTEPGGSRV